MTTTPHTNAEALAKRLTSPNAGPWDSYDAAALIRSQAQEIERLQLSLDCMQQHESKLEDLEKERDHAHSYAKACQDETDGLRKVARQALEASDGYYPDDPRYDEAMDALRKELGD